MPNNEYAKSSCSAVMRADAYWSFSLASLIPGRNATSARAFMPVAYPNSCMIAIDSLWLGV